MIRRAEPVIYRPIHRLPKLVVLRLNSLMFHAIDIPWRRPLCKTAGWGYPACFRDNDVVLSLWVTGCKRVETNHGQHRKSGRMLSTALDKVNSTLGFPHSRTSASGSQSGASAWFAKMAGGRENGPHVCSLPTLTTLLDELAVTYLMTTIKPTSQSAALSTSSLHRPATTSARPRSRSRPCHSRVCVSL